MTVIADLTTRAPGNITKLPPSGLSAAGRLIQVAIVRGD
jgi:hypothetical protein